MGPGLTIAVESSYPVSLHPMQGWPPIEEPELLARLALGDAEFRQLIGEFARAVPAREFEAGALAHAIGYPWARPPGSYELREGAARLLSSLPEVEREALIDRYRQPAGGRVPLLAIGSNAAPEVLQRKFAHFEAPEDRAVLALTGWLRDFDVGAAATVAIYGSMPATVFPSAGNRGRGDRALGHRPAVHPAHLVGAQLLARPPPHPVRGRGGRGRASRTSSSTSPASAPSAPTATRSPWRRCRPAAAPRWR